MNELMIRIDPYQETVTEVPFTDALSQLCQLTGGRRVTACLLDQQAGDSVLIDADVEHEDGLIAPSWKFVETGELFFGTGLLLYVSETGQYRPPLMSRADLLDQIEFTGFTEPMGNVGFVDFADLDFQDEMPEDEA